MKKVALFWRGILRPPRRRAGHPGGGRPGLCRRPGLEILEDRLAPAAHDTLATAVALCWDGNQQAQFAAALTDPNQADLYQIPLHAGDLVTAAVMAYRPDNPLDSALRVFDAGGRQMAFDDNQGGFDPGLTFTPPATAVYYIGVSSAANFRYDPLTAGSGAGGSSVGNYTLNLARSPFAATGSNHTTSTADVINGNAAVHGTLAGSAADVFQFTVAGPGLWTAAATPAGPTALLARLTLYDAAGQLLITAEAAGPGQAAARLEQHLQSGTYYLAVAADPASGNPPGNPGYVLATTFAPALPAFSDLPVGFFPTSLAVGDFNGDGLLDLVAANSNFNAPTNILIGGGTVSVLLGRGDGTFRAAQTYAVGTDPQAVTVGDFNGRLDIVTANARDNTVSVLRGNGDGTFQAAVSYPVGNDPVAVAVGDFSGRLGIVTANARDGTVSVLLGNGDGTFGPARSLAVGNDPVAVTVGAFGAGGPVDIVTANNADDTVSVLRGNGDGTFGPATAEAVGLRPDAVAVGDVNGDGRLDLVTANAGSTLTGISADNTVSVLLGNGDGTFAAAVNYGVGNNPVAVAVGQFTGDGHLDLVTTNRGDNTLSVLPGKGDGTFGPAASEDVGSGPTSVAVGDLNGDGRLDLVTANNFAFTASVLLGRGDGTFLAPGSLPAGVGPAAVAVGQFTHDGTLDLVAANPNEDQVSVLLGRGDGTFQPAATYPVATGGVGLGPLAVAVGDLNGAGTADIVTANHSDSTVSVLLGRGDGTFLPPAIYHVGNDPDAVALGDLNGDGRLDLVTANKLDGTVSVLLGNGDGTFQAAKTYAVGQGPAALAVGTFTDDGHPDIVTANAQDQTVSVLLGNGDGSFRPAETYAVGKDPVAVAVGTFTGDGHPDIVTANAQDNTLSVLLGNGDGSFQKGRTYAVGNDPNVVAVGAFTPDGHQDLVTDNATGNALWVLPGNGDGTFGPAQTYAVGIDPQAVAVGDCNGDGRLDVVTANQGVNTLSVLLGQGNGRFQADTPENGIALRNVPILEDLSGARDGAGNPVPDELILNSSGDLLFRKGLGGDQFAPPVTINPGHPARDVTAYRTASGWAVAAADAAGATVSLYAWDAAAGSVQPAGTFPAGALPVRIAAQDLTGNGLDDLVVANDFDRSVTIAFQGPAGRFDTRLTRDVGAAPSDIAFADLGGTGGADIVVSNQVSGDSSVLFNDSAHLFTQQSRYRAGGGLFDIAGGAGGPTVTSLLQTVGVAAGDFTGSGHNDLVVVNRGVRSFTLLPALGPGRLAAPQPGATYPTSTRPVQVVGLALPGGAVPTVALHDDLPAVAILMADLGQIWVYRNQGDGTFAAPVQVDAGNAPTGFAVATVAGQPALLVGNGFGDVLTLLYDGHGSFRPDPAGLQQVPLAVGELNAAGTGRPFAVVADEGLDRAALYEAIQGTDQFKSPVPVTGTDQFPLLAPGFVQTFSVPHDPNPYLAVARSLSNNVLLYHYDPAAGQFAFLRGLPVGDDPVSITAADVTGDGIPDLLVANQGSNDVSVLIGATDPATGLWTETPHQRLSSGGSGPLMVTVTNAGSPHGPDLQVVNSDGTVDGLSGIGSGGQGSGFFHAPRQQADLDGPIARTGPPTGPILVVGRDGSLDVLADAGFRVVADRGVAAASAFGTLLVAGFQDGTVGLLSEDGTLLASRATGFTDEPSALEVLQEGDTLDVFATERGNDAPVIVSFALIPVLTELPPPPVVARGTSLPGADLVLVATLFPGGLVERLPDNPPAAVPREEVFTLFVPPTEVTAGIVAEAVVEVVAAPGVPNAPEAAGPWGFRLGALEALRQGVQRQELADRLADILAAFRALLDRFGGMPGPPSASPISRVEPEFAALVLAPPAAGPATGEAAGAAPGAQPAELTGPADDFQGGPLGPDCRERTVTWHGFLNAALVAAGVSAAGRPNGPGTPRSRQDLRDLGQFFVAKGLVRW